MSSSISRKKLLEILFMAMMKQKGSRSSMDVPMTFTQKKRVPWICPADQQGLIDCSTPNALMQSLIGEIKTEDFFSNYWEKKPLIVKRNDPKFYGSLFTHAVMEEVLKANEFDFHTDITVCHEKDFMNELGRVTVERAKQLIEDEKATLQFYHPQRYIDELWKIIEELETYFGSLVGSNAFMSPANSIELAAHCEDVETFILVIEGEIEWKLYKPMVELSRDYTQDLLKETIGEPTVTILLQPGDLLYFPRGTIHQCRTTETANSAYLAVSTYLQNTWGDFMCHAVSRAIENGLENDVSIRSGLPINYHSFLGTGKNMSKYLEYAEDTETGKSAKMYQSNLTNPEVVEFKKNVQNHLAKLVDFIDINMAADAMCQEFMGSRLPPYGHVPENPFATDEDDVPESGKDEAASDDLQKTDSEPKEEENVSKRKISVHKKLVTINDHIKIKYPQHIRLVYNDEDGELEDSEIDSDDEEEEMEVEGEVAKPDAGKKKSKSPGKARKTLSEGDDEEDEDAVVDDTEPFIQVCHSLHNDRFSHMGYNIYDEVEGVKFDVIYTKAVVEFLNTNDFVCVKDLLMDEDDEKLLLANRLARDGLLEIKSE